MSYLEFHITSCIKVHNHSCCTCSTYAEYVHTTISSINQRCEFKVLLSGQQTVRIVNYAWNCVTRVSKDSPREEIQDLWRCPLLESSRICLGTSDLGALGAGVGTHVARGRKPITIHYAVTDPWDLDLLGS